MTTEEFLSHLCHLGINLWLEGEALRYSAPKEALTQELRAELAQRKAEIVASLQAAHPAAPLSQSDAPSSEPGAPFVAPRTPTEDKLAGIWATVLDVEQVGVHDNFFDLGGDSVVSMQIVARANQLGLRMAPWQIFEHQTIAALAPVLDTAQSDPEPRADWEFFIPAQHDLGPSSQPSLSSLPTVKDSSHLQKIELAPLSFTQELLWFFEQLVPGGPDSIIMFPHLEGHFDAATLEQSINQIVQRQRALRTVFTTIDGHPMQVVTKARTLSLPLIDLTHLSDNVQTAEVERLIGIEAGYRFDLAQGPLFRASLLRLNPKSHILLLNAHHIIFDGWSRGILIDEILTLHRSLSTGDSPVLPKLSIQYTDYARWQRETLQGEVLQKQISYWKRQLDNASVILDLPTDRPRPPMPTFRGARQPLKLSASLSQALRTLSQREGVSLFMTLLAAFKVLLHRYTGADTIGIGTYVANRDRRELERLIGLLITPLPLYSDLSGNPTFRELLGRVRKVTLEAYIHREIPPELLLNELLPPQERRQAIPLFQVMLIFQNMPTSTQESLGQPAELADLDVEHRGYADSDLTLSLSEANDGLLVGSMEYSTDLFNAGTITRLLSHFRTLLQSIVANPEQRLSELPLLTQAEEQQLLREWNATATDTPSDWSVRREFERQVAQTPDAVAVCFQDQHLTFAALNRRANQLAHYLQARGIGPEMLAGICVERSPDLIIGLLGILKAGAAYLPLDPTYPQQRLAFMLTDAQIQILLTQQHLLTRLPDSRLPTPYSLFLLDTDWQTIAQASAENPPTLETPANLAYMIYTSGSTGQPKGVQVSQGALGGYVASAGEHFALTPDDSVLQFASISFDTAAEEIYPCLLNGARLVLRTDDMIGSFETFLQTCAAENVTVLDLPTAYWHALIQELENTPLVFPPSLRLVIIGGEAALPERLAAWRARAPACVRLLNTYGPTEATIVATACDLTGDAEQAPIGKPIPNTQVYVLDPHLHPSPIGVPGELYVGGANLARGYLHHPNLTAESFVPNPFLPPGGDEREKSRLYKTSDLARFLPDGNLEFLGRLDYQVKIRGFRVELGEIEAVLRRLPSVQEAVVLSKRDSPDEKRLVAYVVPREGAEEPSTGNLRDDLRGQLPDYMVPSTFVSLDALPLTSTGKVNRRALLEYDTSGIKPEKEFLAPETPLEKKLAAIWTKVLGVEHIGAYDSFFDLGGHSLKATRIMYFINQAFPINLPLRTLFKEPTVAGLALRVEEALLDMLEERARKRAHETDGVFDDAKAQIE